MIRLLASNFLLALFAAYAQSGPTVMQLMEQAYDVAPSQISGAPDWVNTSPAGLPPRAKPAAEPSPEDLQNFLATRFHLAAHRETKQMPILVLKVADGGAKLQDWAPPLFWSNGKQATKDSDQPSKKLKIGRDGCPEIPPSGIFEMVSDVGDKQCIVANGETMPAFARLLSRQLNATVVNSTGIADRYDIRLHLSSHSATPEKVTEIEKQLGLKLESRNGLVSTLVIDHIEKPAEN